MPYSYAMALLDAAIARSESAQRASGGGSGGRTLPCVPDEPFVSIDGHVFPPGLSQLASMMAPFNARSQPEVVIDE